MKRIFECPCEEKQHEISDNNPTWSYFMEMVREFGEFTTITYIENGKNYKVPKVFIAKHGIAGKDLPSLGFPEV